MAGYRDGLKNVPIRQSLIRPMELMGGERELVLISAILSVGLAFAMMGGFGIIAGAVTGMFLYVVLMFVVLRMGKADLQLSRVFFRHLKYRSFYPARGRFSAPLPNVRDFKK